MASDSRCVFSHCPGGPRPRPRCGQGRASSGVSREGSFPASHAWLRAAPASALAQPPRCVSLLPFQGHLSLGLGPQGAHPNCKGPFPKQGQLTGILDGDMGTPWWAAVQPPIPWESHLPLHPHVSVPSTLPHRLRVCGGKAWTWSLGKPGHFRVRAIPGEGPTRTRPAPVGTALASEAQASGTAR